MPMASLCVLEISRLTIPSSSNPQNRQDSVGAKCSLCIALATLSAAERVSLFGEGEPVGGGVKFFSSSVYHPSWCLEIKN
jgi:hypothetical protein